MATATSLLRREPPQSLPEATPAELANLPDQLVDAGQQDLARKAAQELGYDTLLETLEKGTKEREQSRTVGVQRQAVLARLVEANIIPFTPASVESYKKRMTDPPALVVGILVATVGFFLLGVVGVVAWGIVALFAGVASSASGLLEQIVVATWIGVAVFVLATLVSAIFFLGKAMQWEQFQLRGYERPVPEFAIETALAVKRIFPGATLMIDELVIKERPRDSDPFLFIKMPDESTFYLEVWNEPSFKGERLA